MQTVGLAAGEGTRLRPLTAHKSKVMVSADHQPLIAYCFDQLINLADVELIVGVGYKKYKIIGHFADSYRDVPITYPEQEQQDELADALLTAEDT